MKKPIIRPSARIILADDRDRVLLFLDRVSDGNWFTPGGGLDRGETVAQAGARELAEETGLRVGPADLGPVVAVGAGYWHGAWDDKMRWGIDSYFFVRTPAFTVDTSGFTDYERDFMAEHRWWTLAELEAAGEKILPWGLTDLLPGLLAGRTPPEPVELVWHHPEYAHLEPPV